MLSKAKYQPKSTVELGYMCPRGLLGPPAVTSKQKAFQKLVQRMELNENQDKSAKSRYWTRMHNKNSVCTERNSPSSNPLGHNAYDIPERYNLYSTSEPDKLVASNQRLEFL